MAGTVDGHPDDLDLGRKLVAGLDANGEAYRTASDLRDGHSEASGLVEAQAAMEDAGGAANEIGRLLRNCRAVPPEIGKRGLRMRPGALLRNTRTSSSMDVGGSTGLLRRKLPKAI